MSGERAQAGVAVHGDLALAGRWVSYGVDANGGRLAQASAQYEALVLNPSTDVVAFRNLPVGMPTMALVSWRDTREGPLWKRTYSLKSLEPPSGGSSSMRPRDRSNPVYRLQTTLEEAPMATHPNIHALLKKYAGKVNADGTVEWPQFYSKGADGAGLVADRDGMGNPMWGQTSWRAVSVVFSARYFVKGDTNGLKVIESVLESSGTINNPAQAPTLNHRNWLHLGASLEMSGPMYEVEESWLASQPGGWFADLYSREALNRRAA